MTLGGLARGGSSAMEPRTMADSGITCCLGPVYRENPDFLRRKTLDLGKGLDMIEGVRSTVDCCV